MPAFRGKNLRSGDLAEQLGVLLLQSVALVAPIPRTEDVGIDVVATLITDYDKYKYIAEDSFLVQIKSSSISEIEFVDEQVKWLRDLQLPLFIAAVDRKTSSVKVYSTHSLSDALVENPKRDRINLMLTEDYTGDIGHKGPSLDLPIGPYIIEWSLETIESNPNFVNEFYQLIKLHILLSKKAIETRRVGFVELATWKTGQPPVVYGTKISQISDEKILDEITAPYFNTLLFDRVILEKDIFMMRSLYRLLDKALDKEGHFENIDGTRQLKKWTAPHADKKLG